MLLSDADGKVAALRKLVNKMPKQNRSMLSYLVTFLYDLATLSDHNGMTPKKSGQAFGIFILRPKGFKPEGGSKAVQLVQIFILKYNEIFT